MATVMQRRPEVDALRVFACAVLFVFHAGKVFDSDPVYHVKAAVLSEGLGRLTAFIHQWHMPLFFFIAGWTALQTLCRRPAADFLRERWARLLVPLAAGIVLLCPAIKYLERMGGADLRPSGPRFGAMLPAGMDFLAYARLFFTRIDHATWSHLWFLAYLLLISTALLPLLAALRHAAQRGRARLWVVLPIVPLAVTQATLRAPWSAYPNLYADWGSVAAYAVFFLAGALVTRVPDADAYLRRLAFPAAATALVAFAAATAAAPPLARDLLLALAGWAGVVGAWGLAVSIGWRDGPALRYLARATLPVYVLHHLVLLALAWQIVKWGVPPWAGMAALAFLSAAATLALYHWVVLPLRPLRLLLGMRA
jgi:fucose 4-O-acetylase-like acetyltransferase